MVLALPLLTELVLVLVAFGLATGLKPFAQMLGHAVGSGGWIGSIVNFLTGGIVVRAENAISHWAGIAIQGVDSRVGTAFHALAMTVDRLTHTFGLLGSFADQVARRLAGVVSIAHLMSIVRVVRGEIRAVVHTADQAIARAIAHDKRLVLDVIHPINARLKALSHAVHVALPKDIARALAGARAAEKDAAAALAQVGSVPQAGTVSFAAAVSYALAHDLGLGGLNCDSNPLKNNTNSCSWWGDLAALLGLAVAVTELTDFEKLIRDMGAIEGATVQGFYDLWNLGK